MAEELSEVTELTPNIFCVGASHKSAPVELRESLHLNAEKLGTTLPAIRDQFNLTELAALSTCNRCELFGVARVPLTQSQIQDIYIALQQKGHATSAAPEVLRSSTYVLQEMEAVSHMFRVAASLDSLVVGETQITGQFKDAVAIASSALTLGPILGRLAQEVLGTAKKIRTQTGIGRRHVSISSAAIDLAKRVFGDLSNHRFLIVGAGEMASVACRHIITYKPKNLTVVNRTTEKGAALVQELGFGAAASLENIFQHLCDADVVITATGAPGFIITRDLMRRVQAARSNRQMFMIDIALPRDIDPACADLEDVYLFDIDDLQQVIGKNTEERLAAAAEGESFVSAGVQVFEKWLHTLTIKPALQGFRSYLDDLFTRESSRSLEKELFQNLNEKQLLALNAMLKAISGRISGDASQQIKVIAEAGNGRAAAELLLKLFPNPANPKPRGDES